MEPAWSSIAPPDPSAPRPPARGRGPVSLLYLVAVAAGGGVFGTVSAFFQNTLYQSALLLFVVAPAVEEVLKPMGVIYLLERQPERLASRAQVVGLAALGGLVFAGLENLFYLHIRIPLSDVSPGFDVATFRWTVCVALHVGCSTIMGLGLAREYGRFQATGQRLELERVLPYYAAAVLVHGAYNTAAWFFTALR